MDLNHAREILLDHARRPRHRVTEAPLDFTLRGECKNPLCGDHVQVFVELRGGRITTCRLLLHGCTMCTAAASLMAERVVGLTPAAARTLGQRFAGTLLTAPDAAWPAEVAALEVFTHLRVNRARIPCALIPWYALREALK